MWRTISGLLEVDVCVSEGAAGDHVTANSDGQHRTGRRELFKEHGLGHISVQISNVQRSHFSRCMLRGERQRYIPRVCVTIERALTFSFLVFYGRLLLYFTIFLYFMIFLNYITKRVGCVAFDERAHNLTTNSPCFFEKRQGK